MPEVRRITRSLSICLRITPGTTSSPGNTCTSPVWVRMVANPPPLVPAYTPVRRNPSGTRDRAPPLPNRRLTDLALGLGWVIVADGSSATGRGAVSSVSHRAARTIAAKLKTTASMRAAESNSTGPDRSGRCKRSIFTCRNYTTWSMAKTRRPPVLAGHFARRLRGRSTLSPSWVRQAPDCLSRVSGALQPAPIPKLCLLRFLGLTHDLTHHFGPPT
jgi:hypothetical protein